jgi:long-chain acyl-CoA synthetase
MRPREGEWLATGDLAAENESGELRFLGRKADVIVTRAGMNVHPVDLEEAMRKQPGVRGCVVVSCETMGGAEPVAAVLFSGSDDELQVAAAQANRGLAEYQRIRRTLKWPELQFPCTSTGKLLRRKVAQWACETILSQQQGRQQGAAPGGDVLVNMIAEVTGEQVSGEDDRLRLSEDLHLDSLGRVQLQSVLEQRLGLELEDDAIAAVETLGDLRGMVKKEAGGDHLSRAADGEAEGSPAAGRSADAQSVVPPQQIEATKAWESAASEHTYQRWPWAWPVRAIRIAFIEVVMRPLIWLLAAPRVVRQTDELPQGPVLVIANHVTAYDGALILYALPGSLRRQMAVAMSGEMLLDLRRGRNQDNLMLNLLAPVGYWLVTGLFNVFPLPRMRGFRRSFAHAGEAMDRGYSVLIFPEGTRSRDGKLQPFRPGIGLLAEESSVPSVPVALIGLGELRAGKTRWFRSGRLEVRVGEAVPVDEVARPAELTARFEESVQRLQS